MARTTKSHAVSVGIPMVQMILALVVFAAALAFAPRAAEAGVVLNCVAENAEISGEALVDGAWQKVAVTLPNKYEAKASHSASVDIALRRACGSAVETGLSALSSQQRLAELGSALCAQADRGTGAASEFRVTMISLTASALRREKTIDVNHAAACGPLSRSAALGATAG